MQEQPGLTVDCVVFDPQGRLLLVRRKNPPFQGEYALPGGFVEVGETTEDAALRELREETGMVAEEVRLIGVYSNPRRDPRRHIVSIAYLVSPNAYSVCAGDDAASAEFVEDWTTIKFAFDHATIISDARRLVSNV